MKYVVAVLVAVLATPALAEPVELPLKLRDGATWTITAVRVREETGARPTKRGLTTVKTLTWKAGGAGGARATLTVSPVSATPTPGSPVDTILSHTLTAAVTLEVDAALRPGAIQDAAAFRASFSADALQAFASPDPIGSGAAKSAVLGDLMLTRRAQNSSLKLGAPLAVDEPAPPFRSHKVYELVAYEPAAGRAVVTWSQSVDAKMVAAERLKVGRPDMTAAQVKAATKDIGGRFASHCRYEIDIPTGLAVKTECRGTMTSTRRGRTSGFTDTWTIIQTLPEPA